MIRPTPARLVLTTTLGLAVAAGAAPPASATVVPIPMRISVVRPSSSYFRVCGEGIAASAISVWHLQVVGARDNGTVIQNGVTTFQPTIPAGFCIDVPKNGAPAGAFVATLTYTGAGIDLIGALPGDGRWAPGQPDDYGGTGIGYDTLDTVTAERPIT